MRRMWQIWPGPQRPATEVEEQVFLQDLLARTSRPGKAQRDDVTALLSILRCGASLEDAMGFAPGLKPATLLAAYRKVESLRAASVASWMKIVANPTPQVWRAEHSSAARLMPVAVERIANIGQQIGGPQALATAVAQVEKRIAEISEAVHSVEQRLLAAPPTMPQAAALSEMLYNPSGNCLYADPFYLPGRVSTLSPARVSDLLGEPRR